MKNIYILGHSNVTLGIILDSLYEQFGERVNVKIISNITKEQNDKDTVDYSHNKFILSEYFHTDFEKYTEKRFLLGAMTVQTKKAIVSFFQQNHNVSKEAFTSIIHPSAVISLETSINHGSNISPGVIIAQHSNIGRFVTINRAVTIGHHTTIGDFTTINPGCNIAGFCEIGQGVTIGMGANILDEMKIGNNSIIGAGSLVNKDVPENTMVYGVPAKAIKTL